MRQFLLLLVYSSVIIPAKAWVYPEHRLLSILAIQNLDAGFRQQLNRLWAEARMGHETRLTAFAADPLQQRNPKQLDYASWPAIAGDHSCSATNMLQTILNTQWILAVADIGAGLGQKIAAAKTKSQRINALRFSDMQLLKADGAYASRAGSGSAHFLLPRKSVNIRELEYFESCMAAGAAPNALGIYAWYHAQAISKAKLYASGIFKKEDAAAILLAAFADEAFALHFLQDSYAAGHVAGSWGSASIRKGTHDYYNEAGLQVQTWEGKEMVVTGDAYLNKNEADIIAGVVGKSLEYFLMAATINTTEAPAQINTITGTSRQADSFNICTNTQMPLLANKESDTAFDIKNMLVKTLVPGLESGVGALPRFRSELGTFVGVTTALTGSGISGGFGKEQSTRGVIGGLEANLRFGVGLEGVLNQSGDGLAFIELGWKQDAASTNSLADPGTSFASNALLSYISARSAYSLRLRLPFYLIPGDLILASPLLLFSPKTYSKMAASAVNGGLIPWQSGFATRIGRFQLVLGREISVSFYGIRTPSDYVLIPVTNPANLHLVLLEYKSTKIDLPILEYRPFRNFSQTQSSSVIIQFNMGVDIPHHATTITPVNDPVPALKNIWYAGLRVLFNWRHYF